MDTKSLEIRLDFIEGLNGIVLKELASKANLKVIRYNERSAYIEYTENFSDVISLRSIIRAYLVTRDHRYNPRYVTRHKSLLSGIINTVSGKSQDTFKTFKIICAGSASREVREIADYIYKTYKMIEKDEADMKLHITKSSGIWEVGSQITRRPLSLRDYKVIHMPGAIDPTIAFAINSLCDLEHVNSYLNVFSGSATLLIEAAEYYPQLKRIVGFDNNKEHLSIAAQNIKKAGLMRRIELFERDIFEKPEMGKFSAITSNLPFGMAISKNEDLKDLYKQFFDYCRMTLAEHGTLVVYTSLNKIIHESIPNSGFAIQNVLRLKLVTNANSYLHPKIYVCRLTGQ